MAPVAVAPDDLSEGAPSLVRDRSSQPKRDRDEEEPEEPLWKDLDNVPGLSASLAEGRRKMRVARLHRLVSEARISRFIVHASSRNKL